MPKYIKINGKDVLMWSDAELRNAYQETKILYQITNQKFYSQADLKQLYADAVAKLPDIITQRSKEAFNEFMQDPNRASKPRAAYLKGEKRREKEIYQMGLKAGEFLGKQKAEQEWQIEQKQFKAWHRKAKLFPLFFSLKKTWHKRAGLVLATNVAAVGITAISMKLANKK